MLSARKLGKPAGTASAASRVLRGYAAVQPLPLSQFESSCPFQTDRGLPPSPQRPTDPSRREAAPGKKGGNPNAHRQPPSTGPKLPPAPGSGRGLRPPACSYPAPVGLTLSARWWTRPRPGSTSSCSSPSSGNSRRPAASRGLREPEEPTGAGAAMLVPASPAASSPAHFRGLKGGGRRKGLEEGSGLRGQRHFSCSVGPGKSPRGLSWPLRGSSVGFRCQDFRFSQKRWRLQWGPCGGCHGSSRWAGPARSSPQPGGAWKATLGLRDPAHRVTPLSKGWGYRQGAWPLMGLISRAALTRWKMPSSWLVFSPLVFLRLFTLKFLTKWL